MCDQNQQLQSPFNMGFGGIGSMLQRQAVGQAAGETELDWLERQIMDGANLAYDADNETFVLAKDTKSFQAPSITEVVKEARRLLLEWRD